MHTHIRELSGIKEVEAKVAAYLDAQNEYIENRWIEKDPNKRDWKIAYFSAIVEDFINCLHNARQLLCKKWTIPQRF